MLVALRDHVPEDYLVYYTTSRSTAGARTSSSSGRTWGERGEGLGMVYGTSRSYPGSAPRPQVAGSSLTTSTGSRY
mgnify:CR=1 FL=1